MPLITATPLPAYGWVRVDLDWRNEGTVAFANLERVVPSTGEVTPIRPHTTYDGWYQRLSESRVLIYDTEAPLDVPFYYRTARQEDGVALPASVDSPVRDTFTRTVAAGGLGTSDSGQTYTLVTGSAASEYSVPGTFAQIAAATLNASRRAEVNGVTATDVDIRVEVQAPVAPTGVGNIQIGAVGRVADGSNYAMAEVLFEVGGAMNVRVQRVIAGAFNSPTGSVATGLTYGAANWYRLRFQMLGNLWRVKVWNAATPEPATWQISYTEYALAAGGRVGLRGGLGPGITNALPYNLRWDNLRVTTYDVATTPTYTLASGGNFWLRSPLHPAKDRQLLLKPTPGCPPTAGKFFIGMDQEQYVGNNATLAPVNRRLSTFMSRPRRGADSTLTLVTRTFADRDEALDTLSDGTALQFAAPPAYGIATPYMGVGDVSVQRGMTDHRFQPRVLSLPFTQVSQPAGPATGVTGARHKDLCATYATWDAAAAAGKTYDDLIRVV